MLSSALTNLNHSDSSEGSTCSNDTILKVKKINEFIKSSNLSSLPKSGHGNNPSKLFSIDSILKSNKKQSMSSKKSNETDSSSVTDEGEDGEEKTPSSQSSMKSSDLDAASSQFTRQLFNNTGDMSAEQGQLQRTIYDQLLLNNIQNTFFKNCFSNPSSAHLLLNNLSGQQQMQDFSGLGHNFAQLSQAAALANNYFLHSKTSNAKTSQQPASSSLCNSTSSLSSSSSSLSSSSDLSNNNKLSPSLSPVTGNINNTNIGSQFNMSRNGAVSSNSQHLQQEAINKQNSEFKNYFGALPGGALNANQFQRLTEMASGFAQNSPFPSYNPFLTMNSNNGKFSSSRA